MKTMRKRILRTLLLLLVSSLVLVMCDSNVGVRNYVVTFSANGGYGSVPNPQTVQAGSSILLPSEDNLSRSGFEVGGWNTDADGRGTNYNSGASFTPTGHITLYARWYRLFTVTFDANGGIGEVPDPQIVREGRSITLPRGNTLSKSGFDFIGWNTEASGSGTNYKASSSFTPTDDITLYANWEKLFEAPEIKNVTATSSSTILISWSAINGAIGYNVYRSLSADGTYSIIRSAIASTSYTDTWLSPGTTYYYKVSAVSSTYKESRLSSYASATTLSM